METINSVKGYRKVSEIEDRAFHKKTHQRLIIIGFLAIFLVTIIVGAMVETSLHKKKNNSIENPSSSADKSIKGVCSVTKHPDSCYSSISSIDATNPTDPEEILKLSIKVAMKELEKILSLPESKAAKVNDPKVQAALKDCRELFDDAIDLLNKSLSSMQVNKGEKLLTKSKIDDLKTWLSATITDQETCLDGLEETSVDIRQEFEAAMRNATEFSSNSLGIVAGIFGILERLDIPIHRKLLAFDFPDWVSASNRRRLF